MGFNAADIPDQTGKVAIITGANTGLGKINALELARKGCHVILACRSKEKTDPVVEEIKKETGNEKVEFMSLDLSSLASVKAFSDAFIARDLPLHMLIANAGIMYCPFALTADGIESQFGVNHIAHSYLTMNLLPVLEKSKPSRIIILSSLAHSMSYSSGIQFDKINDKAFYSDITAYGQSKLSNLLFVRELAKKLDGKEITVVAVHPGYVATELQRHVYNWGYFADLAGRLSYFLFAMSPEKGALTQLYAATSPEIIEKNYHGKYLVPIAKLGTPNAQGRDDELAKKLWDFTQNLLKEKLGDAYQPPL